MRFFWGGGGGGGGICNFKANNKIVLIVCHTVYLLNSVIHVDLATSDVYNEIKRLCHM